VTLSTRTAAVAPSGSAPLTGPPACVAPPAQFGRPAQAVGDLTSKGPVTGLCAPAGSRPRTLSVMLDDPVATARSLRHHMQPADLMELDRHPR